MRIIVGISGASSAVYGWELLKFLKGAGHEVHCVVTPTGWLILQHECGIFPEDVQKHVDVLHRIDHLSAGFASGSYHTDAMVVVPCSMRTIAAVAHGLSDNLLCRAADVMIKERRKLILVPRETPLSSIHLRNMLTLSDVGVTILPACPGFYPQPETLEDLVRIMVGRIADSLGVANQLYNRWQ